MEFDIIPLQGVGNIRFGMNPDEVRRHFGAAFISFKRTPNSQFPCDYFESLGTFFYYSADGKLEAIEFSGPADPSLNGVKILTLQFDTAKELLESLDERTSVEVDTIISPRLGVSVYSSIAKEDTRSPIEMVMAFREGYL
ncbi:hypothetical protein NKJ23_32235 [Mesorhizobium sp. M0184]|uniref:hypothetical protein n=1 Tax=Mesorhizobium sp. M0184 TaxID=2956906 RepID=UPI003334D2EB